VLSEMVQGSKCCQKWFKVEIGNNWNTLHKCTIGVVYSIGSQSALYGAPGLRERNVGAPRAIRLLIKILTWLILQLSKEAITAANTSESLNKAFQFTQEHQWVSNSVFFCFFFRNLLWGSVNYGQSLHGLHNTKV